MKLFGSQTELVATIFRKDSQAITLRPNQGVTYTASRDVQLPPQDTASVLVSADSTQTLTNKSISGSTNTLSNVPLGTATGTLASANGGTGVSSTATFPTSGVVVTEAATETLTNKSISGSTNTITNVSLTTGVTGTLPIGNGGTGQTTANPAFNALSPLTTKGDLVAYSTVNARLPVGSDGQLLTADSTQTLGVKWGVPAGIQDSPLDEKNYTIVCSVAASALTIALKNKAGNDPSSGDPVNISFRNATAATGDYAVISSTAATSVVVSSTATLGHTSATNNYIYVYALNNAGTIELAVSTFPMSDRSLQTTTAMSGSATSNNTMYSTTARTSKAVRLIARLKSNQTTAGTWAAVPTEISLTPSSYEAPRSQVILNTGNGYGSTNTHVRRFTNTEINTGTGITYADSSTLGASFTVNESGLYHMSYSGNGSVGGLTLGLNAFIPNGNSGADFAINTPASCIVYVDNPVNSETAQASAIRMLMAGDVIYATSDTGLNGTDGRTKFMMTQLVKF